jgi:hypothetical protein
MLNASLVIVTSMSTSDDAQQRCWQLVTEDQCCLVHLVTNCKQHFKKMRVSKQKT